MNKILLSILILLLFAQNMFGQAATDFTATDCDGTTHNLYSELNSGKVVVLVWIMPCLSCINDAKGAHEAVQSFASSHAGKVLYYLIDDYGNTSCASIKSWANQYKIQGDVTVFENKGEAIDEDDFGGTGMPHVVVVGPDKQIYLNVRDGKDNKEAVKTAVNQALSATSIHESTKTNFHVSLFPNPANNEIQIKYDLPASSEVSIKLFNMVGKEVLYLSEGIQSAGEQTRDLDISALDNGVYLIRVSTDSTICIKQFIVTE